MVSSSIDIIYSISILCVVTCCLLVRFLKQRIVTTPSETPTTHANVAHGVVLSNERRRDSRPQIRVRPLLGIGQERQSHAEQVSSLVEASPGRWARGLQALWHTRMGVAQRRNGANPPAESQPRPVLLRANYTLASLWSQVPRLSKNVGLLASTAKTKFLREGLTNDKLYEVCLSKRRG